MADVGEFRLVAAVSQADYTDLEFRLVGPNDVSRSLVANAEHVTAAVSGAETLSAEHTEPVTRARTTLSEHLLTETFPWDLDAEHEAGPVAQAAVLPAEHVESPSRSREISTEHEAEGFVTSSRTVSSEHREAIQSSRTVPAEHLGVPASARALLAEHTLDYEGPSPKNVVDVIHRNWFVEVR